MLLTGRRRSDSGTVELRIDLERLREIKHVKSTFGFGSKLPVFNPMRIYEDDELLRDDPRNSTPRNKRIYVMAHINHPREITEEARRGVREALHDAGAIVVNQTPVLRGINDDPACLASCWTNCPGPA